MFFFLSPHMRVRPQCCLALELCAGASGGLLSDSQSYICILEDQASQPIHHILCPTHCHVPAACSHSSQCKIISFLHSASWSPGDWVLWLHTASQNGPLTCKPNCFLKFHSSVFTYPKIYPLNFISPPLF